MVTKVVIYDFLEVGSTITVPVEIRPDLASVASNVEIAVSYGVDLAYSSSTLDIGAYSDVTKLWTIATLPVDGVINGSFEFTVASTTSLVEGGDGSTPITVTFTLDDTNFPDSCGDDNVLEVQVAATPCSAFSECFNNTFPLPTEFVQSDDDVSTIAAGTYNKAIYNSFNILQGFVLADGTKITLPLTNVEQVDGSANGATTTDGDLVDQP